MSKRRTPTYDYGPPTNAWAEEADLILRPMFERAEEPTLEVIRAAYPFGERKYWPYKVWLGRVKMWRAWGRYWRGDASRPPMAPAQLHEEALAGQASLFEAVS